MTILDLQAARKLCEAADEEVARLSGSDGLVPKKWQMSIPARPDSDSDLIISPALYQFAAALDRIEELEKAEGPAKRLDLYELDQLGDVIAGLRRELESHGLRHCDIPACNCGGYHPGPDSAHARLSEIYEALDGCQGTLPVPAIEKLQAENALQAAQLAAWEKRWEALDDHFRDEGWKWCILNMQTVAGANPIPQGEK